MRNKLFVTALLCVYLFFLCTFIFTKEESVSNEERRKLTTLKEVEKYTLSDPYFSQSFERYLLDQIPFRRQLKTLKARVVFDVLQQKDNHEMYYQNEHWFKKTKAYDSTKVDAWQKMVSQIQKEYNSEAKVLIIPDKSYYNKKSSYSKIQEKLHSEGLKTIDIKDYLTLQDYYRGDPHLKQEAYISLLPLIEEALHLPKLQEKLHEQTFTQFYGAYSGQGLYPFVEDTLSYYTSSILEDAKVHYYEDPQEKNIYTKQKLAGIDAYDVFLNGATAYIEINNEKSLTTKSIVVFRDSYGSSISCLLPLYYQNVYVVDLRYIQFKQVKEMLPTNIDELLFVYGENSVQQANQKWP